MWDIKTQKYFFVKEYTSGLFEEVSAVKNVKKEVQWTYVIEYPNFYEFLRRRNYKRITKQNLVSKTYKI